MGDDETEMSFEIYPNPLAGSTTVYFSIEENSRVTVELFDLAGRKIKTVADENFTAGSHEISLNDIQLSAGAYLLRLKNETHQSTLKAIVE
jgi:serine protease AprX